MIVINNPKEMNSYLVSTLKEMIWCFEDSMWDDDVQFIVLTGAGEKAFCTGGNVKEYAEIYNKKPSDFWKWGVVCTTLRFILTSGGTLFGISPGNTPRNGFRCTLDQ